MSKSITTSTKFSTRDAAATLNIRRIPKTNWEKADYISNGNMRRQVLKDMSGNLEDKQTLEFETSHEGPSDKPIHRMTVRLKTPIYQTESVTTIATKVGVLEAGLYLKYPVVRDLEIKGNGSPLTEYEIQATPTTAQLISALEAVISALYSTLTSSEMDTFIMDRLRNDNPSSVAYS